MIESGAGELRGQLVYISAINNSKYMFFRFKNGTRPCYRRRFYPTIVKMAQKHFSSSPMADD